jgi:hypothetical protein
MLLVACGSGGGAGESASTTTTSSPAPEWVRRLVSAESASSRGQMHGAALIAKFATRSEAVETTMHDERDVNVDDPPVFVVVVRGDFVSSRGHPPGVDAPRGKQLTIVFPQQPVDLWVLDYGLGKAMPPPAGSERFSF